MTEPSQYFKGRTVQEQMNEVIGYVDVRSAEVATDAIAADVAQVHQDMLDADADASAAAASAAAAAGTLANAVKKTGEASQSIDGDIAVAGDLTGGTVTVPTPVNNTDAASKKYVDDHDALKLNITDVNTYAVGLTGNQKTSGIKEGRFFGYLLTPPQAINQGVWLRYCELSALYTLALTEIISQQGNNSSFYGLFFWGGGGTYERSSSIINHNGIADSTKIAILTNTNTNKKEMWIYVSNVTAINGMRVMFKDGDFTANVTYYNTEHSALPTTGYGAPVYVVGSA